MKKLFLSALLAVGLSASAAFAQTVKDANLYPTNLEENMYFNGYDAASRTLKGVHFMVLSDGDNSKWVTPAFTVKLYLYQHGKEPIFFKTFEEDGIYHMGKKEYALDVPLGDVEVPAGTYRVGVLVNADNTVKEKDSDNAMLFQSPITIGKSSKNPTMKPFQKEEAPATEQEKEEKDVDE
jgi:opacity protein-like surface antigen